MPERKAKRYFTGKPCPRGHIADRWRSTRACVECLAERNLVRRPPKPAKIAQTKQERQRRYQAAHREQHNARAAAWAKANRGKANARAARRRAAVLRATPRWADQDRITALYELAAIYREHGGIDTHVDHIVPLQSDVVCGLHVPSNLQILTGARNRQKSNRLQEGV